MDERTSKKRVVFVDVECVRLAEHHLLGWKHDRDDVMALAELFQDAAESFTDDMEEEDGRG